MSNQPASDRALRGALSLPGVNAEASRAILVKSPYAAERADLITYHALFLVVLLGTGQRMRSQAA